MITDEKQKLLKLANVIGYGDGIKVTGGFTTGKPCVTVLVKVKVREALLPADQVVPKVVDGVETDVVEVGEIKLLAENRQRHRPVPGGVSISTGNSLVTGTGGLVVLQEGIPCLLSNVHVMKPMVGFGQGARVRQPGMPDSGILDGGFREDDVGMLHSWVELRFDQANKVDCAIADLTIPYVPDILGIGNPIGLAEPAIGMSVSKSGRTSGLTTGQITGVHFTIAVAVGEGRTMIFVNQIIATPMMLAGDSGSVWVSDDLKVVGLGFAGSAQISVANPIQEVFASLNLTLPPAVRRTPVEVILPQLGSGRILMFGFDNRTKEWLRYDSGMPKGLEHLNTLRYLIAGKGYWIRVLDNVTLRIDEHAWELHLGWNLIGW